MARTKKEIYDDLIARAISIASSVGLTINPLKWSKKDYKKLMLDTVADAHSFQEQLYDSHLEDLKDIEKSLPPTTKAYIQKLFLDVFEYDATTVPIFQLETITLVPFYPNPNPNQRIVKFCSVVPGLFGTTTIKIAAESGGLPSKITGNPLLAAQTFANFIGVDGIKYNVLSLDADRLFLQLDVYYNGLYSAVIESNVISAIDNFLNELSTKYFNGEFLNSNLEQAVRNVTGVNDVVLVNIQARANTTTVGTETNLISNNLEIQRKWDMVAGYMIKEDVATGTKWRLTDPRDGVSGIKNLNLIAQ